jgi:trans-2,3-dihydro-3-hydroxyanthranilate isomerase
LKLPIYEQICKRQRQKLDNGKGETSEKRGFCVPLSPQFIHHTFSFCMSVTIPFSIVDVFAEGRYQGNQLAVFEHEGQLDTVQMQSMAREINFAESTFINLAASQELGYQVRIFTPGQELPFAGHPTLGTAYVIHEKYCPQQDAVTLSLGVGEVPVTFQPDGTLWMTQKNPQFGVEFDREAFARCMGINLRDLADFPIQMVSTGIPFVILPLRQLDTLRRWTFAPADWKIFLQSCDIQGFVGILAFTTETFEAQNDLSARLLYVETDGLLHEDSATGSANGCLLSYLLKHRFLGKSSLSLRVEQGYSIPRPSLLLHQGEQLSDSDFLIKIGGNVRSVAKGFWEI